MEKPGGRGVGESVPVIPRGRMDRHTGRFIEHQKIFVFIEDIEIHRDRRDFIPRICFRNKNTQAVSGSQQSASSGRAAVEENGAGEVFHGTENMAGEALLFQEINNTEIFLLFCYSIYYNSFHKIPQI